MLRGASPGTHSISSRHVWPLSLLVLFGPNCCWSDWVDIYLFLCPRLAPPSCWRPGSPPSPRLLVIPNLASIHVFLCCRLGPHVLLRFRLLPLSCWRPSSSPSPLVQLLALPTWPQLICSAGGRARLRRAGFLCSRVGSTRKHGCQGGSTRSRGDGDGHGRQQLSGSSREHEKMRVPSRECEKKWRPSWERMQQWRPSRHKKPWRRSNPLF